MTSEKKRETMRNYYQTHKHIWVNYRNKNLEKILEYSRRKNKERYKGNSVYEVARINAAVKKWRKKYPERDRAHKVVFTEIRAKRMYKLPCLVCGEKKVEAHHQDYLKPLEVMWLCKLHHGEMDRQRRKISQQLT